jgi:hypothetical protein
MLSLLRVLFISFALIIGNVSAQGSGSDPNCPAGIPINNDACGAVPNGGFCGYNFVTCPSGASTFLNFCECAQQGTFFCGIAQPCAIVTTEFPSSAPSEAPVAPSPQVPDEPWTYELPSWWNTVQQTNGSTDLKRCFKRQFPPTQGSTCATRRKVCYFFEQECPGGTFPTTKCTCNGSQNNLGSWNCEAESCPLEDIQQ